MLLLLLSSSLMLLLTSSSSSSVCLASGVCDVSLACLLRSIAHIPKGVVSGTDQHPLRTTAADAGGSAASATKTVAFFT